MGPTALYAERALQVDRYVEGGAAVAVAEQLGGRGTWHGERGGIEEGAIEAGRGDQGGVLRVGRQRQEQALGVGRARQDEAAIGHPGEGAVAHAAAHVLAEQPDLAHVGQPVGQRAAVIAPAGPIRRPSEAGAAIGRHRVHLAPTRGLEERAEVLRPIAREGLESQPAELAAEGGHHEG